MSIAIGWRVGSFRLTVAVAEAFIEQAGGLFVFAVGSVFAVAGAVLVVENAV